ncbi:MAG: topA, partial [Acidobacteria bacterium]|nr:topA [Acidobacteriota bacterium]
GEPIYLVNGRFGPYVQRGETPERGSKAAKPARASLPTGWSESGLTLDQALQLLDLPRVLGTHPDDGEPVVTNFGRFGPYVKHGSEFRSLDDESDVFTVSLDHALELLRQPKRARRQARPSRTVLRELGPHPDSGAVVKLMSGRYGPYVTDGTTNATVPKGTNPDSVALEQAVVMLRERAAAGPSKRVRGRRASGSGAARRPRKPRLEA